MLTRLSAGITIPLVSNIDSDNIAEITSNGVRAVIEIRSAETGTGNVIEAIFLTIYNERDIPLRVVVEGNEAMLGPEGVTEILVGYRSMNESGMVTHVDTDIGRITWDTVFRPPRIKIDSKL
jgi:hypothetical protein